MLRATLLALLLAAATGCATHLSTLQTAETLDPGHVRIAVGAGAGLPAAELADAKTLADSKKAELDAIRQGTGEVPDEATQREILRTAASLAVFPPEPIAEVSGRLGLLEGLDLGLTWSSSAWRIDGKWRLTAKDAPLAFALVAGVEVYTFDVSLFDYTNNLVDVSPLFEYVHLENPQRYDLEGAAIASFSILKILKLYVAGKYRAGLYHLPIVLNVQTPDQQVTIRETLDGVMHYYGGVLGLGLGLPFVHVLAEVNVGMTQSAPMVLGQREELGGLTVYPAAALAFSF